MARTRTAMMVVVAVVLLMQCCNVILAARPLPDAAAGDGGRWRLWQGAGSLILQALPKGNPPCPSDDWNSPVHPHCQR
jgi:hypothetical protein